MNQITAQHILLSIPNRFRAEKAQNYETVFHFDISGDNAGQYTVLINNQVCELKEGLHGTAQCVVKTKAEIYLQLEIGKLNPQLALMTGKVKVSNIAEMIRFSKMFKKFDESVVTYAGANLKTETRPEKNGPLKGLKILDFTRLLPGPMATMLLADMGADVVKIEDPDSPDYIRNFPPFIENQSAYYLSLNRSKKSLAINFTSEKGKEIIFRLVKDTDVLLEQYRPGIMQKMGLDYEALKAINPKLIYVSITGYGQESPYSQKAGHDLNYLAISGLLGITGTPKEPIIPGMQIADVAGGSYMAVNACLAALFARERTGAGQQVDVSMTDTLMPLMALQYARYQTEKNVLERGNFELSGSMANYNVYECADEKWMALGALEPKFWEAFCDKANMPEWKNKLLLSQTEMNVFKKDVAAFFKTKTQKEWIAWTAESDFCLTPVLTLDELEHNEHIAARKMLIPENGFNTIAQPLKFSEYHSTNQWQSPKLGADTISVLRAHGYRDFEIEELIQETVIKVNS